MSRINKQAYSLSLSEELWKPIFIQLISNLETLQRESLMVIASNRYVQLQQNPSSSMKVLWLQIVMEQSIAKRKAWKPKVIPESYETDSKMRLIVLGDRGVGKSAITIQFVQYHFVTDYDPTVENSYRKQIIIPSNERVCMLDIMDAAIDNDHGAMRSRYICRMEGMILVYSITSQSSFREVRTIFHQLQLIKDEENLPVILVGNKSDLVLQREVSKLEGIELAESLGIPFVESSAKSRENIDELFYELCNEVIYYRFARDQQLSNIKKMEGSKGRKCNIM